LNSFKSLNDVKINFIIGPGRSGTTLLTTILNQHKHCIASPEIKHIIFFYHKYGKINTFSEKLKHKLLQYLKGYLSVKKLPVFNTFSENMLDFIPLDRKISFKDLMLNVYFLIFKDGKDPKNISVIIDKNPLYTFYVDELKSIFPEAKFLVLIRDYRAYVNSVIQNRPPFTAKRSIYYYAYTWNLYAREIISQSSVLKHQLLIIKYEDFVINQEVYMSQVLDFFRLEKDLSILNFHDESQTLLKVDVEEKLQYDRMVKKLKSLSSPIDPTRINSWQKNLNDSDLKIIEKICGKNGSILGYEKTHSTFSIWVKFKTAILGFPGATRVKLFYLLKSPQIKYWQSSWQYARKLAVLNSSKKVT
jgi:hypothetical protein